MTTKSITIAEFRALIEANKEQLTSGYVEADCTDDEYGRTIHWGWAYNELCIDSLDVELRWECQYEGMREKPSEWKLNEPAGETNWVISVPFDVIDNDYYEGYVMTEDDLQVELEKLLTDEYAIIATFPEDEIVNLLDEDVSKDDADFIACNDYGADVYISGERIAFADDGAGTLAIIYKANNGKVVGELYGSADLNKAEVFNDAGEALDWFETEQTAWVYDWMLDELRNDLKTGV